MELEKKDLSILSNNNSFNFRYFTNYSKHNLEKN
jgi:hypothetical protein